MKSLASVMVIVTCYNGHDDYYTNSDKVCHYGIETNIRRALTVAMADLCGNPKSTAVT